MANNPSLNAKVVTSITKSSSGKTTYNTTGGNAKTSTPKLPSYSGNKSGGNSYSGSGAYRMSADQYDRYEQDYTTWKQTGQHTSGYSSWGNQRDLDTWKSIRDGKVKSARVGNDIYYMDNDSYKRYTKDYDSWSRTGSHSADYGKWANNDGTTAFRYIRDDANGYGGLNNLKASLDDELTKAVAEKYRSQWGDKYYYDVTNPDDIAAMNAGRMPTYLQRKYKTRDPIDQWLMEQGLPYGSLFNDMYSEAWQDRNERNAKRQKTYESAFNDMAAYQRGMNDLKQAMVDGMSFEDALATGRFDALGDFYDSSFGKTKENDSAGDQYYKAKKTQLDPVYDRAYEAMLNNERPDDEFFDQYKESSWKSYLKQKQKWNESSLQDVFDYQAIQNAGALIQESIDENKLVPVSKQAMKNAGYRATDEWTMFSPQVFTNKDGTQSIVLNPIREDGTVIPKADLEKIAKRRLGEAGLFGGTAGKDDQSAFIAEFDTKKEARDYANSLSDAVTTYYRTDQEDFGARLEEARNRGKSEQQAQLDAAVAAGDVNAVQELVPDATQEEAEQLITDERVKAKLEEAEPFKARLDEIDEKLSHIQDGYMGRRGPSPSKRAEWDALLKEKNEVYAQYRELIDTATGIANTTKQDAVIDAEIKSNETTGSYVERPDFIENSDSFDRNAVTGSDKSVASVNEILNNYADGSFDKIMRGEDVSDFASSHVNANDQGMWRTSVFNEYYSARYMTDDEARTFEYIAKTEGADAAVKYMDDLLPVLNWRNSEEVNVKMAQEAGRNPVISWLAAGISQFVDMFEGYAGFWNSLGEISGDPDARGAMANDPRFNVTRKYDMVDAALAQETDRRFGSKALNYVQNMATNLRDNVMRQAAGIALEALFPGVGKVFSTAAVTGSVLGQSLMENMDKGVDLQKATLLSFLNAGAEALGEAISMDALLGFKEGATDFVAKQAAKGIAASPGQIIRNYIFGTGLKEGGSEFMTSLMSMAAEALTLGDDSDVMQFYNEAVENGSQHPFGDTVLHVLGQAGSEGIAGALTGYILGGPTSISNTIQIGRASGAETNQFRAGLDTLNLLGQEEVDFHKALESKIEVAVAESGTNIQSITRLQIQQDIKDSTVLDEEDKNVLSNIFELVGSAPGETLDAETQAKLFNCVKALHQSVLDQNAKDAKTEKKASKADQRLHDYFAAVAQYQLEAKMALESGNLQAHAAAMNNLTGAVERYKYALTERDQDQTVDEAQQAADQEREKTKLEKAMEPVNEAAGQVTAWYQAKAAETRAEQEIAKAAAENAAPQQEEPLDWQVFNLYEKLTDASENGDQETIDEAGAEFERLSAQYGEEFNKLWQQAIEGTLNPQPVRAAGSEAQFYADLVNDQSEDMMRARAEARDTSIDYSSIDNAARSIADRLLSDEERIKALRKSKVSLRRVRADLEADIKAFAKLFGVSNREANVIPTAVMRELDGIVNDIKTGEIRGTIDEIVRERLKKTILDNYIVYAPTLSSIYNEEEVAEIKDWIKGKRFRYLFEDGKKSIVSYEIRNEARKQGLYFTKKGKDSLDQAYHDIQDIWKDGGIVSGEAMSPEDQAAEILEFLQGNTVTKKPKTLGEFIKDPHNEIDPRGVDDELNKMMNGLLNAISPYLDERERIGVEKYGRNTEAEQVYGGPEQVNPGEAEQQFYDTAIGAEPAAAPDVYVDQAGRVNGDQAESLYRSGPGERTDGNGPGPVSIEGESPAAAWSEGLDQRAFFDTIAKDYNTKNGLRGANALKAEDFEAISAPSTEESAKALRGAVQRNGGAPVLLYRCTKPNAPGGFVHNGQIYINEKGTAITSFEYGHEIAHLKKRIQDAGRRVFNELGQEGKQAFLNYCEKFRENPNDAQVMTEFICDIHGAYEYLIQRGVRLHDQLGLSAEQANAFYDAFSQANAQDSEFDTDDIAEAVDAVATNGNTDYNYHSMDEDRALTEEEANQILAENGRAPQEWQQYQDPIEMAVLNPAQKKAYEKTIGPLDLDALGYDPNATDGGKKLLDPVTYDDNGNVIPLSQRFNPDINDPRYSSHNVTEPTEESDFYSDAVNTARQAQDLYQAGTSVAEYMANAVYDPDVANQLSGIEQRNLKAPTGLTQDQRRQMYEWDRERLRALKTEDRARLIEQKQKMLARQSRAKSREHIVHTAKELRNWMNTPNVKEGKYVPTFLQESVLNALQGIDLGSTERPGGKTVREWRKSMQDLANSVAQYQIHKLSEDSDPRFEGLYMELPDGFVEQLQDLAASIPENGKNFLQDMDSEWLMQLDKSLAILKSSIKNANEIHANGRKQMLQEVGNATIRELSSRKAKKESDNKILKGVDELFNAEVLDPNSYAKRLGNTGGAIIHGIMDGFVNGTTKVREASEFVDNMEKEEGITKRDTYKWSNTPLTVTLGSGETISMTEAQAMNLYALSNRPQAMQHIVGGGIELGYNRHTRNNQNRAYKLSYSDMDNIFAKLSDKQKTYVDRLQTYLSTTASEWGNEVSQKLYGIDLYGEENYWPIRSAKSNLATQDPEKVRAMNAIMNSSFTNALNKHAKNPIMLDDVTQVFADHIAQMSNYNGLSIPIANAMKWFNYQRRGLNKAVDYNSSVKRAVVNAMGRSGASYFINLIKDVNGLSEGGTGTALPSAIVSNAKRAAVAAKLRVMIQQPTAIVRAMAMVNPKYFVGISNAQLPSVVREMQREAPIAWWKSQGNFDIGTGKSMRDILFGDGNAYDQTMNAMMAPAGWADDFGWAVIWNAVKREQQARNKGLSEKDLMAKVVRRFTDVINDTQVIDTVVHRSQIMRSKDSLVKQGTAFMSEPMKTLNMLRNAVFEAKMKEPGAKGRLFKTGAAVAGSWALNAAVLALHDSLRDRDEDEDFWEMAKEKWLDEFWNNVNQINAIPYLKDVAALVRGDDVDRMDMSGLGDLITSIQRISKAIQEGESDYTTYGLTRGLLTSIGNVLGTPVNGLISSAETLINGIKPGSIQRRKSKGWDKAETLIEEGIDKNAARGLMKNFNSDNTATKAFSILTYDADNDGVPDFDEDEQNAIAIALGLSYDPERDGSLQDYAVNAAEKYLKQKQKIMDDEDSTDEEYAKAEEAYDKYSQMYDDWFEFLGL